MKATSIGAGAAVEQEVMAHKVSRPVVTVELERHGSLALSMQP
jgi:hypothetical protein